MVSEVYPSSFLDCFKGPILTSKSVFLATKNIFTFAVDRHLDKPLTKAVLESILETPVYKVRTRPSRKTMARKGQFRKRSVKTQLKTIQVSFINRLGVDWMAY